MQTAQISAVATPASHAGHPDTIYIGTVRWFNPGKGYGFIAPAQGGDDIFVHISAVQHAGMRKLIEGERIRFHIQHREGRIAAIDLERAD